MGEGHRATSKDALGRGTVTYRRGTDEVEFLTPRPNGTGNLPGLDEALFILPKAIISAFGVLCFSVPPYRIDATWNNYPYRFRGIAE